MIRVIVTPPEVLLLLDASLSVEVPIVPVLLPQVDSIRTIFLVVVYMIVAASPIVVPPVVSRRRRGEETRCPTGIH